MKIKKYKPKDMHEIDCHIDIYYPQFHEKDEEPDFTVHVGDNIYESSQFDINLLKAQAEYMIKVAKWIEYKKSKVPYDIES